MREPYASKEYYLNVYGGNVIPEDELEKSLIQASRHIDTLTFNRIVGRGIDGLTPYQKDTIQECCCKMAEFEYANEDLLKSVFSNYSINGVSMTFAEGWNVKVVCGVAVVRETYEQLQSTGLCCRML